MATHKSRRANHQRNALVRNGRAANEPWKFYDLGHGYCTYDFFDQCPHRMACAKCSFYLPKDSSEAQLLEAKANLMRLRQDIPLAETDSLLWKMALSRTNSCWQSWPTYRRQRDLRRGN
jgi:hypothetical protein